MAALRAARSVDRGFVTPRLEALLVFAIAALAIVLQFADLSAKSLWVDEVATVRIAREPSLESFFDAYQRTERQPPLHHLILHGWIRVAGDGDGAVRVPSAVFSVASVLLVWRFGRRAFGSRTGLLSAYLLAISPVFLLYGRMGRYFSLSVLLALASTLLLVRGWNGGADNWAGYAGATFALLMTNFANLAIVASQGLAVLAGSRAPRENGENGRRRLGPFALSLAAAIVPFAAWVVFDFSRVREFGAPERPFDIGGLKGAALDFAYPIFSFTFGETIFPWHPAVAVALPAAAWALVSGVRVSARVGSLGRVMSPWLVAGTLTATVASYQTLVRDLPFVTLPARALGTLPFFLLLVAAGVAAMRLRWQIFSVATLTVVALAAGLNYFDSSDFHNPALTIPKRRIVSDLIASSRPQDLVIADEDVNIDYYFPAGPGAPTLLLSRDESRALEATASARHDRVWLVVLGRDGTRGIEPVRIEAALREEFDLVALRGYLPQDSFYSRVKESVQGFEDYRFKVSVRLYERSSGSEGRRS